MPKRTYVSPARSSSRPCWVSESPGLPTVFALESLCRTCGTLFTTLLEGRPPRVDELCCPDCDGKHLSALTLDQAAYASLASPARRSVLVWH